MSQLGGFAGASGHPYTGSRHPAWWYLIEPPQGRNAARAGGLFQVRGVSSYPAGPVLSCPTTRVGEVSTALYRRYRPETFADVIGQAHVTEPLMQALRTGRVNHAYLFSGPRGCGKTTSARILARCLNCAKGPTPEPCGICESCVALARGGAGSIDVIEIDAASHGGVDDARDLRERASYGPAQSRYKVYIIDEAHMVTTQGFNALLKIVEEPPEHVKFVFATTEPDKVIGTIRSRTHHYPFRLVPPQVLHDYLGRLCEAEGVAVEPGVLSFVVRAGGGSVRDSLSVLDQLIAGSGEAGLTYDGAAALLGFTDVELLDATVDALAAADAAGVFTVIDRVIETGLDPRRFVEDLLERLRDLIVVAAVPDGTSSLLRGLPEDQVDRMRHQAAAFGQGSLSRAADIVNAGLTEMTGATAPRLQLELIAARVLLPGAAGESGYAARLDRLERRLEVGGTPSADAPLAVAGTAAPRPSAAAARPEHDEPAGPVEATGEPATPARGPAGVAAGVAGVGPAVPGGRPGQGDATERPSSPSTVREPAEPVAPSGATLDPEMDAPVLPSARGPGGIDTAAIRRSWPDILAWIFRHKRATWTLLSEHATVQDYDGTRVQLAIATVGLANTFRTGTHAELVRQAMIDVLGVDALVEGTSANQREAGATSAAAPPAPQASSPWGAEQPGTRLSRTNEYADPGQVRGGDDTSRDDGARGGATHRDPARDDSTRGEDTTGASATDDTAASVEDEDVKGAGEVGRSVVERLLGGQLIHEGPDAG
jgi:DNA polymerase-3 subunit gamma/tau